MQVTELKEHLKDRKLSTSGLKHELAKRLKDEMIELALQQLKHELALQLPCLKEAELSRMASQAKSPTTRAAGAVDPGDATTARKVRTMCTGFAKCTGDD